MNGNDILVVLIGYLLGSIPFGLLLTRVAGLGDIRSIGSGNIGATNVLRTGHKGMAAATLLLDGTKGACAVWIASMISPCSIGAAAIAVLVGHMFPIWLKFMGGKGVATFFGATLALAWPVAIMAMLVWLGTALVARISSVAALTAVVTMPIFASIFGYSNFVFLFTLMGALVVLKHWSNIFRLFKGTEPSIGKRSDDQEKSKH